MRYFCGKLDKMRGDKYNFVDENNVVVGYDAEQNCCENAGFYFVKGVEPKCWTNAEINADWCPNEEELKPYRFDPGFYKDLDIDSTDPDKDTETSAVMFRCVADGLPDLFLVLHNTHNGYYSHGFTMCVGGVATHDGSL